MAEFVGMLETLSICLKSSGFGPSLRAAREYIPRQQPSIRPFIVPMQEMAMKRLRILPSTPPKMFVKALVAPSFISTSTVAPPATPT